MAHPNTRLREMHQSALRLDENGDVVHIDPEIWAQARELAISLGQDPTELYGLTTEDGHSAWLRHPQWILRWRQPDSWAVCCRLFAADAVEHAMAYLEGLGGEVDALSRRAVPAARRYARGQLSQQQLFSALRATTAVFEELEDEMSSDHLAELELAVASVASELLDGSHATAAAEVMSVLIGEILHSQEELRVLWLRLQQYAEHGAEAAKMPGDW